MNHDHSTGQSDKASASMGRKRLIGAVVMLAFIGMFFLLKEHWSHVAGYWPYLLLLACPLMHLFHGHGGHGSHNVDSSKK
ncbi:hypothetical protein C8C93_4893 [Acidovorax sp. 93]|nr:MULTISPECIES: DUF2933 domain-containing protein [Acidovorax]MBD9391334.1 DUF2933 domain-containing protein [Acidovorax sp. ACV01]MBO1011629.1 DUF2933 domain-containing protein [Acidovorax sp. SD340]MBU2122978.1 DUF2933 domain-containing protein [Gammaproteobacteria bacterium]PIF17898.1 Protein of unknown function (DUF2933) [Acidovorax sp. 59]PKW03078.1 Protein of unknown function (DUF2933) [Acidovorax sp. 30]RKR29587.1 hypothetical protein C8C93_4893 [Acidovorax sp. 93]